MHCLMSLVVYSGPGSALSHVPPCLSQDLAVHCLMSRVAESGPGSALSHVAPCLSQDLAMHCPSPLLFIQDPVQYCLMSRLV
jgi:hypothetical protein